MTLREAGDAAGGMDYAVVARTVKQLEQGAAGLESGGAVAVERIRQGDGADCRTGGEWGDWRRRFGGSGLGCEQKAAKGAKGRKLCELCVLVVESGFGRTIDSRIIPAG